MLAGTTHSNTTSPVIRGAYIVRKLMCMDIPLPTAALLGEEVFAMIKPPEPYCGQDRARALHARTARSRSARRATAAWIRSASRSRTSTPWGSGATRRTA